MMLNNPDFRFESAVDHSIQLSSPPINNILYDTINDAMGFWEPPEWSMQFQLDDSLESIDFRPDWDMSDNEFFETNIDMNIPQVLSPADLSLLEAFVKAYNFSNNDHKEYWTLSPTTMTSELVVTDNKKRTSLKRLIRMCQYCRKSFRHSGDYKKHLRVHTKERPYKCNMCKAKFTHSSNLRRHERTHINIKQYKYNKSTKKGK